MLVALLATSPMAAGQGAAVTAGAAAPSWHWRCDSGGASLNFHPATLADGGHALVFDSVPYAAEYTMVVVYKPVADTEASVWRLDYGAGSVRGLTTEHIVSDSVFIRYANATAETPVINTLRQSAPDSTSPFVRLTIGGDSLSGKTHVAEILYFSHRLDNPMLRRVQSALAIRYGITLGPVDYVDGHGKVVWKYADRGMYHHRVTGVGRDSTYNIHQPRSRSEMAEPLLTVVADSLSEGLFWVCGDNDAPLLFEGDGDTDILKRRWRIRSHGMEDRFFTLTFDTRGFPPLQDSLVLLVDGQSHLPDSVSPGSVTYKHVVFPADTGTFTLARGSVFWRRLASRGRGNGGTLHNNNEAVQPVESQVYPNPSSGDYTIEVTGASWVTVSIYNLQGKLMEKYDDSGSERYLFTGTLPAGNAYYATVTTEAGSQTMKLIVK